jgi:hypothetical protein
MKIREQDFEQHAKNYDGYCRKCDAITAEGVEPDAMDYDCDVCGTRSVMGIEMALIMGRIKFIDDTEFIEVEHSNESF